MAGRVTCYTLGLSNNVSYINPRNSLLHFLWRRGRHSSRNRSTNQRRVTCPENIDLNREILIDRLDMIEEQREKAAVRIQIYQQAGSQYYDPKIRDWSFSIGDLVLRKVFDGTREPRVGKLGTKWEGPYKITKIVRFGVYELEKYKTGRP